MAQYDITDTHPTTPEQPFHDAPKIVPVLTPVPSPEDPQIAQLLATLEQIPRAELPDSEARNELSNAIRMGAIDNLYRPLGTNYHNISFAHLQPWQDPRLAVSAWVESWRRYSQAFKEMGYDVGE